MIIEKTLKQRGLQHKGRYVFNKPHSFGDTQNYFHTFQSLIVLDLMFLYFCVCKNISISTLHLLVT